MKTLASVTQVKECPSGLASLNLYALEEVNSLDRNTAVEQQTLLGHGPEGVVAAEMDTYIPTMMLAWLERAVGHTKLVQ